MGDFEGKYIVLYFYPRDNTPGCTLEANEFQEALSLFKNLNAVILEISTDSQCSRQKFAAKFGLTFELLCDEEHQVVE